MTISYRTSLAYKKLVIRTRPRDDRLQQSLSAATLSIWSGELEWPPRGIPLLDDVLVDPPHLGITHFDSPTADVNTPSQKQKEREAIRAAITGIMYA